jgi:osmoprotectant transport system permease protein
VRGNPVFAILLLLGLGAATCLPLLNVAPNRLVSGQGVLLWEVLQTVLSSRKVGVQWGGVAAVALGCGVVWGKPSRVMHGAIVALAFAVVPSLVALSGAYADQVAQVQSPIARTSWGSAFWVLLLCVCLMAMDALYRLQLGLAIRAGLWLGLLSAVLWQLAGSGCEQLSLMKEYVNHADAFLPATVRHLQIVALALLPSLCLGLPLGWLLNRHARWQGWLLPPLNIIQTIPSIAIFGLLMAPMAWLAATWPGLTELGISGIGVAPAVVALTLYSLLPIVRGTQAGLASVPSAVLEAARGMGMNTWQIFCWAQLPLALPVVLAGVRTATIQTVGLTAVTALIGAGGLGAIMFDGLFGNAQDVVLLGVLPILGLALLVNLVFAMLVTWTQTSVQEVAS